VALRMSRDAVDALIDQRRVKLVVDLKPALTEEVLRERIAREIADMEPTEFFTELLRKLVPKPLVLTLVHEMDVNGKNYVSKITEEQIGRLIKTLKGFTFPLTDYAPFEYVNSQNGEYEGFDMDLIREIGRRKGFDVQIISMTLDGLVPALVSGNIDAAVSALTITPERAEKVDFTKPYLNAGLTVMTTKENAPKIKSVKDLENKLLCAEIGSSGALVMKRIPGTTVRTFNSAADAFLELNKGGCFAMLNDGPVNKYFLTQKASKSMNLTALDFVVSDDFYGMAVQKGNKKLLKELDDALDEMRADGTFQKIYDKWFGDVK